MLPTFNLANAVADPKLLESAIFTRTMTPEERKSKIKRDEWKELSGHLKEWLIIIAALIASSIFMYICFSTINNPVSSVDDKKWATSLITLMASGITGYLTGKSSK